MKFTASLFLIVATTASSVIADHCGYCSEDDMSPSCTCYEEETKPRITISGFDEVFYCCRLLKPNQILNTPQSNLHVHSSPSTSTQCTSSQCFVNLKSWINRKILANKGSPAMSECYSEVKQWIDAKSYLE